VGLGDFFRRRKERESAIPPSSTDAQALGSFASGDGQPVIGQQVGGGAPGAIPANLIDLPGMLESMQSLAALGPMIQQAMAQGNVTQNPDGSIEIEAGNVHIQQDSAQTIDMRGTELGDEIRSIMKQHGIDPEGGASGTQIDASAMPAMQQQILEALGKYGLDPNASGSSLQFGTSDDDK
jgi:hypothetical protein